MFMKICVYSEISKIIRITCKYRSTLNLRTYKYLNMYLVINSVLIIQIEHSISHRNKAEFQQSENPLPSGLVGYLITMLEMKS